MSNRTSCISCRAQKDSGRCKERKSRSRDGINLGDHYGVGVVSAGPHAGLAHHVPASRPWRLSPRSIPILQKIRCGCQFLYEFAERVAPS